MDAEGKNFGRGITEIGIQSVGLFGDLYSVPVHEQGGKLKASDIATLFNESVIWMNPLQQVDFSGPRELTGAVDLISRYKLLPHYEFFGKRSIPLAVADTHYLHNVVGDTEIRKGEGMQLNELIMDNTSHYRQKNTRINPFDVSILGEAFQLRETAPIDLSASDKGVPTIAGKSKSENKDRERKHKRHKDKDRDKDKEHKKHKHRHKDRSNDKDKDKKKGKNGVHDLSADQTKKHQDRKRKHNGNEDINDVHIHKKSKHKSSRIVEMGAIRVAG